MDTLIERPPPGKLKTTVYRKKTHTNQYLAFTSHHPLHHKLGVVRTLLDRCESVVTEEEDKVAEQKIIKEALAGCGYPQWSVEKVEKAMKDREAKGKRRKNKKEEGERSKGMVILPYVRGLSEKVERILKKRQISTAFRPHKTLRNILVHPKDKNEPREGVYTIDCMGCNKKYVGETKRRLAKRVSEHKTDVETITKGVKFTRETRKQSTTEVNKSAITDHVRQNNHIINWDSAKIVQREANWTIRGIKEAITIRQHETMNRDEGRHKLSHLYDDLLLERRC